MTLTTWRKSSFSEGSEGNCVEVAFEPAGVALRDSKNPTGPMLTVDLVAWQAFTASVSDQ